MKARIQGLEYDGRCLREDQLNDFREKESFTWIWTSHFTKFLSEHCSIFWIRGKPGSGKSTLMNHLWRSGELSSRLLESTGKSWTVIRHFFDFRAGDGIRNNLEGFLKSLLFQVLLKSNNFDRYIIKKEDSWSIGRLRERLLEEIERAPKPLCLLVDGLDEYENDKWDLAKFLRDIANSRCKLCLASRPETVLKIKLEDIDSIELHEANLAAITQYVDSTLRDRLQNLEAEELIPYISIAQSIAQKSEGVFIWARFAIEKVTDGVSEGLSLPVIQERLEGMPKELEQIYSDIFANMEPEPRRNAGHMLQLVCYAKRPLRLEELLAAWQHTSNNQDGFLPTDLSNFNLRRFEREILSVTSGLLNLYVGGRNRQALLVSLMHKTVRTYLDSEHSERWFEILGARHEGKLHAEAQWLRVCATQFPLSLSNLADTVDKSQYLSGRDPGPGNSSSTTVRPPKRPRSFHDRKPIDKQEETTHSAPLQEYAATFMPDHAMSLESDLEISSYSVLRPVLTESFLSLHIYFRKLHGRDCTCLGVSSAPRDSLDIAVSHGLSLYVADCLAVSKSSDRLDYGKVFSIGDSLKSNAFSSSGRNGGAGTLRQRSEGMSLLEYAVRHAGKHLRCGKSQHHVVASILEHRPHVDNASMVIALQRTDSQLVQLLLRYRAPGKMIFAWNDVATLSEGLGKEGGEDRGHCYPRNTPYLPQSKTDIGPFWIIAGRDPTFKGRKVARHQEDADLIKIFIERGEDINELCGPYGTALHGVIFRLDYTFDFGIRERIKALITQGADVNKVGLLGNPLEFAWVLANTSIRSKSKYPLVPYFETIKILIEHGAVNKRVDPNGQVPTQRWMLFFCTQNKIGYERCKRLYAGAGDYELASDNADLKPGLKSDLALRFSFK